MSAYCTSYVRAPLRFKVDLKRKKKIKKKAASYHAVIVVPVSSPIARMQLNTTAYMRRKVTERQVCLVSKSSREASSKNVLRLISIHIYANEKGLLETIVLNLFLLKAS